MEAPKVHYQVQAVTVTNGTSATEQTDVTTDSGFKRCTGIAVIQTSGSANVRFGFSDKNRVYSDPIPSKMWDIDTSTPVDKRFTPVDIPANGRVLTITTEPSAAVPADQDYDVVFRLEN